MSFILEALKNLSVGKCTEVKHPVTNLLVMKIFTLNGKVHRDDGPAMIHYDTEGKVWAQEWYCNGMAHREDGPAKLYLKHPQPQGKMAIEANGERIAEWYRIHPETGKQDYYSSGVLNHETFMEHWHKEDKSQT